MSGDIAVMYLYCACIVFEAKDPFYVGGHHQMRSFVFKRADLALIGFSAPCNLVIRVLCSNINP